MRGKLSRWRPQYGPSHKTWKISNSHVQVLPKTYAAKNLFDFTLRRVEILLYPMAMAWRGRRSSKCDMSTWTDKTVSAVRDLEKSLNSYDVLCIRSIITENYISKDYQVDLVRVARAYVGAIEYGIFVAQKGYNIASTSITTLGGPTGKELLSPQDKQEAFESVRAQAEKGRELTQDTLNRFNQVHGDIESVSLPTA